MNSGRNTMLGRDVCCTETPLVDIALQEISLPDSNKSVWDFVGEVVGAQGDAALGDFEEN